MSATQAVYYRATDGCEPVDEFLDGLPAKASAKIDDAIEEHLNGKPPDSPPVDFPYSSQIEGELRELRVRFANTRYRILYQRSHNLFVLLHAIEKNTGRVRETDKAKATQRMADFTARMNASPRIKPRAAGKDAPGSSRQRGCPSYLNG